MLHHPALLTNYIVNSFAEFRIRKYISFTASDSPNLRDMIPLLSEFSCGPRFEFMHNLPDVLIGPNQYVHMIASNVGCRQLPLPDAAVLNDCFKYNNPLSLIQRDGWRFQFRKFLLIEMCIGGDQFWYAVIPDDTVSRVSVQPASVCCKSNEIRYRLIIQTLFPNNYTYPIPQQQHGGANISNFPTKARRRKHIQFPNNSAAARAARKSKPPDKMATPHQKLPYLHV
jgi:hypothetical protein